MELRPGRRFEMSSHFMPLPRSSMIRVSSSGDHLLCFLAGDSDVCDGMLRFPPPLPGRGPARELGLGPAPAAAGTLGRLAPAPPAAPRRGDSGPAAIANEAVGGPAGCPGTAADAGTVLGGGGWVGDTEDSLESGPLRRELISTMTVSIRALPTRAEMAWGAPGCVPWRGVVSWTAWDFRCRPDVLETSRLLDSRGGDTASGAAAVVVLRERGWELLVEKS